MDNNNFWNVIHTIMREEHELHPSISLQNKHYSGHVMHFPSSDENISYDNEHESNEATRLNIAKLKARIEIKGLLLIQFMLIQLRVCNQWVIFALRWLPLYLFIIFLFNFLTDLFY